MRDITESKNIDIVRILTQIGKVVAGRYYHQTYLWIFLFCLSACVKTSLS